MNSISEEEENNISNDDVKLLLPPTLNGDVGTATSISVPPRKTRPTTSPPPLTPPPQSLTAPLNSNNKKFSVYNPYKTLFLDDSNHKDSIFTAPPEPTDIAGKQSLQSYPYNLPTVITINVSGYRFQTTLETLERYKDTLLGNAYKRDKYWNPITGEYFFDRHRQAFEAILFFYQSGGFLYRPQYVPLAVFHEELKFFQMSRQTMIKFWNGEGFNIDRQPIMPLNTAMTVIWKLMEYPKSSVAAMIMTVWSMFVILVASFSFMLETVPRFRERYSYDITNVVPGPNGTLSATKNSYYDPQTMTNPFYVIEVLCILWFTIEYILRLMSCPSKASFLKSFFNWVDFLSIIPFYIALLFPNAETVAVTTFALMRILRLMRVLRILKFARYSRGLQILGLTFRASFRELSLLVLVIILMDVLFASAVYIAEYGIENAQVRSIPEGLWYCIVTMTTNGYGDFVPVGTWGRLVGGVCAVSGVLIIALPIPVIVKNFKHFIQHEYLLDHVNDLITRQDERVRLVLSGKNALKKL